MKFLEEVFEDNTASEAKSFLELGCERSSVLCPYWCTHSYRLPLANGLFLLPYRCGSANHAIRLAKKGHKVYALDVSNRQLEYAKKKAADANAVVRFLREDMCDFELPVS